MGCVQGTNRKQVSSPTNNKSGPPPPPANNTNGPRPPPQTASRASGPDFRVIAGDFVKIKKIPFTDEYVIKDRLGEGGFGEVRKVLHRATGLIRAVKIIKKESVDPAETAKMLKEIEILTSLDHANIMKVYEMFEEETKYYIVSEYLEGGELFDKLSEKQRFSEKDAAKIIKQVLSAVSYSHQHQIVHRDLKPENLVYESKDPEAILKVIDFGTAGVFKKNEQMEDPYGTAYYIAPEMLTSTYTEKCDIWSCGVILYLLLSGTPPFTGKTEELILERVVEGKYDFSPKHWEKVSDEAKEFVKKMMEVDVNKRYTAEQALNDPWIKLAEAGKGNFDHPLASANLSDLQNFRFKMKLQETAWVFLVSYFSTKEEKSKLLETFKSIDKNHDGQLTKEELKEGYIKVMGLSDAAATEEAEKVLASIDANKSGKVDYSEFINATISRKAMLEKDKLEAAFKLFDKNKDGRITADELKHMFNDGKARGLPADVWNEWISQADKNGDGGICIEEFKDMMVGLMKAS